MTIGSSKEMFKKELDETHAKIEELEELHARHLLGDRRSIRQRIRDRLKGGGGQSPRGGSRVSRALRR